MQPEAGFLKILQSAGAVLMTPKTDGASITLLQSLWLGIPVVSTPTIGALEWLANSESGFSPLGSEPGTLALAVEESFRNPVDPAMESQTRSKLLDLADLGKNVRLALRGNVS